MLNVESLALMADGIKTLEGREAHTFYLQELVAVVARYRSADRTIQTRLLVWRGSGSNASRGEGKLKELEDRYRMQADLVHAGRETSDFVKLVGGVVVVRHGQRARFDPINTALYRVQAIGEAVFVDEVDLVCPLFCSARVA